MGFDQKKMEDEQSFYEDIVGFRQNVIIWLFQLRGFTANLPV